MGNRSGKTRINKVIAVGNPKGGVGKTATTISIARIMKDHAAFQGKRILLIDTDPLGILTKMIVGRKQKVREEQTLMPVFLKGQPISSVIQMNAWPQIESGVVIDYICSNRAISRLESIERLDLYLFKRALEEIADDYFKILIDCPANSNNLYFSSCIATDQIIFPFGSIESLAGLEVTCLQMCQIDEQLIDNIKILFTMQDIESELTASLINTARQYLDFDQFQTIIRRSSRFSLEIAESQTTGTYHVPDSIAINDYLFMVEELFAADFGKPFQNMQRFNFGSSKIDERLWAAFYETSFLITNEREKAKTRQPRGAIQQLQVLERELKSGEALAAVTRERQKTTSKYIIVDSCLKTCSTTKKILGNSDCFYIAELLPEQYKQLKKEGKNRYVYLYHPECFELLMARLFFQQDHYEISKMSLSHILRFSANDRDVRLCKMLRKRFKNSYMTFIRDPRSLTEPSYLVHFWTVFREREYITRWHPRNLGDEISLLGGLNVHFASLDTIVVAMITDEDLSLTKANLQESVLYRNFQSFKVFLEEKLKTVS